LGLALYFASQGAGRLLWPLLAGILRLIIAAGGGWIALHWFAGELSVLFIAIAVALTLFGITVAVALQAGAWAGAGKTSHGTTTADGARHQHLYEATR
jgi:hypothetical protein